MVISDGMNHGVFMVLVSKMDNYNVRDSQTATVPIPLSTVCRGPDDHRPRSPLPKSNTVRCTRLILGTACRVVSSPAAAGSLQGSAVRSNLNGSAFYRLPLASM